MKYNTNGYYWISLVGSGVSRGAGQFFLFKASERPDGELTSRRPELARYRDRRS